jgi:hypothetical protein
MDEPRWCPGSKALGIENHWSVDSNFYRRMNNGKKRVDNLCKQCRIAHTRDWRRRNKDKVSAYNKTWRERNLEEVRVRQREFYRMAYGKGAWTWKRYRPEEKEVRIPVGPFKDWLEKRVAPILASKEEVQQAMGETTRYGHDAMAGLITWASIAKKIGVDPKSFSNYTSGKSKTVPREIVDRMGLLFGNMNLSDELYPEDAEEAA